MTKYLFLFFLVLNIGCSTNNTRASLEPKPELSQNKYEKLLESFSQEDKQYSGFYNTYMVKATLLSSKIQLAQLDRLRFYLQWNKTEYQKEREKVFQEMSTETKFFLSYYTPEKDLKNLHLPSSLWKVYLEHNGKKYEGKVFRVSKKKVELKKIYPFHTRWSDAYEVRFNLPASAIENAKVKFLMSSSAGKTSFNFN